MNVQPQIKQRNSNLELYRIIVMLLIVAHHYVVNSGMMEEIAKEPLSGRSIFYYIFGMWGKTGINCFVLITGYFMCKSKITMRKFLKLLLQIEFYNIVIYTAFVVSGYQTFALRECIKTLFPIKAISDGFTSCFLVFYLFIPFLNILINNLDKKRHMLLVGLCLSTYTIMGSINLFHVTMNYVTWFCILYFISSYIRLYGFFPKVSTAKWGGYLFISMSLSILSVLRLVVKAEAAGIGVDRYNVFRYVADSNVIFAVTTSITAFMFFKGIKMKYNRWINTIAASTFGVLLIHANSDTMRQWLWKDIVDCSGSFYRTDTYMYAFITVIAIFFICVLMDYVRIHTIENMMFKLLDKHLSK